MSHNDGATFGHGIHPAEQKHHAEHRPLRRMPFVSRYLLPLSQHLGAPSVAVVAAGDSVTRGQLLAQAGGFVSTNLHSPVTGRVTAISPRRHPNGQLVPCIEIEADPYATEERDEAPPVDLESLDRSGFIEQVKRAGLVGMGGAAFPSHVKYAPVEGKPCKYLVINGCECEPYLTCDHRVMVERPEAVVRGVEIVSKMLNPGSAVIGVESNKPQAIAALRRVVERHPKIRVAALKTKYPQGAEKMLIKAIFNQEVPAGGLPLDLGMVVNNVGTMAGLADYFDRGLPFIERGLTVAGGGIRNPANLLVPIGTPVREVLEHCGLRSNTRQVIMGGPMMGQPLGSLDVPVLKGTSGLLAFTDAEIVHRVEYGCVKCGRCLEACACFLNPSRLGRLSRAGRLDDLNAQHIMDCMECGACTYACPSGIPLVHLIRAGKAAIRTRKKA